MRAKYPQIIMGHMFTIKHTKRVLDGTGTLFVVFLLGRFNVLGFRVQDFGHRFQG